MDKVLCVAEFCNVFSFRYSLKKVDKRFITDLWDFIYFQSDPEEERYTFQYGPCRGDYGFLEELAGFLTKQYGDKVDR